MSATDESANERNQRGKTGKKASDAPGPEPARVKIEGDWEEAVKRALTKKPPRPKNKPKKR